MSGDGLESGGAMQLTLKDDLPFVDVVVVHQGAKLQIPDVLVDTGSATTILAADQLAQIDIVPEPSDMLYTIRGVGGIEAVFTRRIGKLCVGHCEVTDFQIEVGGMDYGFEIQGILGMDFLLRAGGIINLCDLSLEFCGQSPD
ncbi:MAG: retropepsin-like aspartic protease [Anaerolineae bacterium]